MTSPDHVDAAAIRILAHPIDDRLAAFTAECLAQRERLRRESPLAPAHVLTDEAKGFARILLGRLQRAMSE